MFNHLKSIRRILKRKNGQIRAEREKLAAAEAADRIYAAYILYFAEKSSGVRVPKSEIAETVGKYRADITATEDEYIIQVKAIGSADKKFYSEKSADKRDVGNRNGACADKTGGEASLSARPMKIVLTVRRVTRRSRKTVTERNTRGL